MVLDVEELRMRYGTTDVLRGVTFQVGRGEVLAVLGPNGAGKTTTIEILEGFRLRSAGRVEVLGVDPAYGGERWRARVGVVLQSWRDHGNWRVRELLAYLGSYYAGYSTEAIRRPWEADDLMAVVGLSAYAGRKVRMLSGGQRRRLDVAIGLVGRPELVFLDEPTAGFDPQARHEFHDLVRRLAERDQTTILLTTHDLSEAERVADRILILSDGRIVAQGTAAELREQTPADTEVRWRCGAQRFVRSTAQPARLVAELFERSGGAITDLEVRRSTLEDSYLALVRRAESAPAVAR